jgi:ComF family protein
MSNFMAAIFDSAAGRRALQRLLPQHCALCAAPCGDALVCFQCDAALPRLGLACPRCAMPMPGGASCGRCLARPPPWDRACAAFAYAFPLDRLLVALKYRGTLAYAEFFAHALVRSIRQRPDAIVALPLAASRQRARGFNQATEIARRIARTLDVPLIEGLVRTRDTPAQAALPYRDRRRNVRAAFAALPAIAGRHVAIVDDVLTTGATLREAARAARAGRARCVDVWVAARTL